MSDNHNAGARERDAIEIASGLLMAAATAASAWCAFQSTLWNGEQLRSMARAGTQHVLSLRQSTAANTDVIVDVNTFLQFVQADTTANKKAADYLLKHARPEFRPALNEWVAQVRAGNESAPLPFKSPQYRIAALVEADKLETQAAHAIQFSSYANGKSDLFVLHTVLFALALFFVGTAGQPRTRLMRGVLLGLGTALLTLTVISMLRLPRAPHDRLRGEAQSMPVAPD